MKRLLFLSFLSLISFWSFSQYIPIAKQGRVWYSQLGPIATEIVAVEGDTSISGVTYPLLVEKDSSLSPLIPLAIWMKTPLPEHYTLI